MLLIDYSKAVAAVVQQGVVAYLLLHPCSCNSSMEENPGMLIALLLGSCNSNLRGSLWLFTNYSLAVATAT